jgi:hypothetical protein
MARPHPPGTDKYLKHEKIPIGKKSDKKTKTVPRCQILEQAQPTNPMPGASPVSSPGAGELIPANHLARLII